MGSAAIEAISGCNKNIYGLMNDCSGKLPVRLVYNVLLFCLSIEVPTNRTHLVFVWPLGLLYLSVLWGCLLIQWCCCCQYAWQHSFMQIFVVDIMFFVCIICPLWLLLMLGDIIWQWLRWVLATSIWSIACIMCLLLAKTCLIEILYPFFPPVCTVFIVGMLFNGLTCLYSFVWSGR